MSSCERLTLEQRCSMINSIVITRINNNSYTFKILSNLKFVHHNEAIFVSKSEEGEEEEEKKKRKKKRKRKIIYGRPDIPFLTFVPLIIWTSVCQCELLLNLFVSVFFACNSKYNLFRGPLLFLLEYLFWLLAKYIYFTVLMSTISEQL